MVSTPVGKKRLYRLYIVGRFGKGRMIPIDGDLFRRLTHVLRLEDGAVIHVFNGIDGEWSAVLRCGVAHRGGGRLHLQRPIRSQPRPSSGPVLGFCPVKAKSLEYLLVKGTELGAAGFLPLISARTVARDFPTKRAMAWITGAAEQCGRLDLPILAPARPLSDLWRADLWRADLWRADLWKADLRRPDLPQADLRRGDTGVMDAFSPRSDGATDTAPYGDKDAGEDAFKTKWNILLCDPDGLPIFDLCRDDIHRDGRRCLCLIGPEGGFCRDESESLARLPGVRRCRLGAHILRSETAGAAALAVLAAGHDRQCRT